MEFRGVTSIQDIARICHNLNKAYCEAIGDTTQVTWEEAPTWQKNSAVEGVKFHLSNETTPEDSHKSWLKSKEEDGWVYDIVKDEDRKTHPCILPYNKLPKEQRIKDHLFKSIVDSFKTKGE